MNALLLTLYTRFPTENSNISNSTRLACWRWPEAVTMLGQVSVAEKQKQCIGEDSIVLSSGTLSYEE